MRKREVKESPTERGVGETYPYKFTLTDRLPSGTYASPTNTLYERDTNGAFLTAVTGWDSGSPSIVSEIFTTASFVADQLTVGERYRLLCSCTVDGAVWSWNLYINVKL